MSFPDSKTRRGRVIDDGTVTPTLDTGCDVGVVQVGQIYGTEREPNPQAGRIYSDKGISPTIDSCSGGNRMPKIIDENGNEIRIRKLTPKECFRLQGFPDEYFERAAKVNSDSQLYKQAGNSVTVNVIYEIAKRLKEIEEVNTMPKNEICGNCKFHKYEKVDDLWFCGNPDSEWYTDWTEYDFECDEFERR